MAFGSLLTLFDDIATTLDDVSVMTKVAAKKTAGLLGDDLALNAEQVTGVAAARELPVVWAVTKGSFLNKLILVPIALIISFIAPWLISPLLMVGGAFLCYEGFEKVFHKLWPSDDHHENTIQTALDNPDVDWETYEATKIKGAIRTDFILSAEIIVVALGSVADASFSQQILVVSVIALLMTVGVYGLVAGIVKLDDLGLYLIKQKNQSLSALKQQFGRFILRFAPFLMHVLSILGTAAMFLVGGGIFAHSGLAFLHDWQHAFVLHFAESGIWASLILPIVFNGLLGIGIGLLCFILIQIASPFFPRKK